MNIPPRKLPPHTNRPTSPPMLLVHTSNLHFTSDSRPKESQHINHGIREVGVGIIGYQPDRTGSVGSYFGGVPEGGAREGDCGAVPVEQSEDCLAAVGGIADGEVG